MSLPLDRIDISRELRACPLGGPPKRPEERTSVDVSKVPVADIGASRFAEMLRFLLLMMRFL